MSGDIKPEVLTKLLADRDLAGRLEHANDTPVATPRGVQGADVAVLLATVLAIGLWGWFVLQSLPGLAAYAILAILYSVWTLANRWERRREESGVGPVALTRRSMYFSASLQTQACFVVRPLAYFMDVVCLIFILSVPVAYVGHWGGLAYLCALLLWWFAIGIFTFALEMSHARARTRYAKGLCIWCGYERGEKENGLHTCSECGGVGPFFVSPRAKPEG